MNVSVEHVTAPFSQWAHRVQYASPATTQGLYEEGRNSHPFSSSACLESCCGILRAMRLHPVKGCSELLSSGVFKLLGAATAADWEGISEGLAHRTSTQSHEPAWLHNDPKECQASVSERLKRACCSSEVAVLMLRLAVRTACTDGSWYGPWKSLEALQQLVKADAWSSLVRALRALLATFGAGLAKQYNAINIVGDILHVSCALLPWFS